MLKKIITLCLSLIFICSLQATENNNEQQIISETSETIKNSVSTIYEDSKEGLSTVYQDIKPIVKELASQLGVAAEHLYGILIKQFMIKNISYLILLIVGICIFLWLIKQTKKTYNECSYPEEDGAFIFYFVLTILIGATVSIVMLSCFSDILTGIFNPEFHAIDYILDTTQEMLHGKPQSVC